MKYAAALLALIAAPLAAQDVVGSEQGRYRVSGAASLRPAAIGDDGKQTFIEWSADQQLPAVFALNSFGEEEIVDGYMRGQTYTIDRVVPRLIFRFNKISAEARRLAGNKRP